MFEGVTKVFTAKYLLICITLLFALNAFAQKQNDSLLKKDTLALYKKIKKVAYKHKATTLLYHAIFVDPVSSYEEKPLSDQQKKEDPNLKFKGKIIRKITIVVLDPFGYYVNDTSKKNANLLQKLGNKYHVTTHRRIIRNLLLFKPNDTLDLIKISESERLIRGIGYVNDARIYIEKDNSPNSDSVDVKVVAQDRWALDAPVSGGTTGGHVTLRDRNIFGSGQRFEQYVSYNLDRDYEFTGRHTIANISNTFISSTIFYTLTQDITQTGISLDRPFYSGLAKWAGGISGTKTWTTFKYVDTIEKVTKWFPLEYYSTDIWIGRNINTNTGKHINRRLNNIVLAYRYAETHYQQRPSFAIDTNKYTANTSLYISSVGFSLSKYYKDQYIFRFGANEDIPEGLIVRFLYGVLYKEQNDIRYYSGFDISRGKHFDKLGYFSVGGAYGALFNSAANSSTINLGLTYFTDLLRSKKWYYRQFIYLKYVNGIHKPSYEKITLRPEELYGLNNGTILGSSKLLLNLEGVTYAPYNIIGFRFAPLVLLGFGMLKTDDVRLFTGHVYQSYAIGLLMRNENLLSSSLQITFGLYPYLPDDNKHFSKLNPVTSFTVKFNSFSFTKPSMVSYE